MCGKNSGKTFLANDVTVIVDPPQAETCRVAKQAFFAHLLPKNGISNIKNISKYGMNAFISNILIRGSK